MKNKLDEALEDLISEMIEERLDSILEGRLKNLLRHLTESREQELLTSKEVRELLKISTSTFNRRLKNGDLKPINPTAKRGFRFSKQAILNPVK